MKDLWGKAIVIIFESQKILVSSDFMGNENNIFSHFRDRLHRKKYALIKKLKKDKKEVAKRKIDCGDTDCPNPKRRPGRPRKTAVEANRAANSSSTIKREKPPNQ